VRSLVRDAQCQTILISQKSLDLARLFYLTSGLIWQFLPIHFLQEMQRGSNFVSLLRIASGDYP
jgi:hypothetical protein